MPSTTFLLPFANPSHPADTLAESLLPGVQEPTAPPTAPSAPSGAPAPAPQGTTTTPNGPSGAGAAGASPCAGNETFMYLGLFLVLMYFMMIRPQQKQQKELQALLSSVKVGDRVVTRDGLHGQIARLTEKTVTLQVDTVQMTYDRTAIARVERNEAATPDAKKS